MLLILTLRNSVKKTTTKKPSTAGVDSRVESSSSLAVFQDFVHASCHRLIAKSLCVSEREKRTEPAYSLAEHAGMPVYVTTVVVMLPWGLFTTPTETGEPKRYRRERQEVQMILCAVVSFRTNEDWCNIFSEVCKSLQSCYPVHVVLTHFSICFCRYQANKNMF